MSSLPSSRPRAHQAVPAKPTHASLPSSVPGTEASVTQTALPKALGELQLEAASVVPTWTLVNRLHFCNK